MVIVILAKEVIINNKEADKGTIIIKREEDINREDNNNISSEKALIKADKLDNTMGKTLNHTVKDNTVNKQQVILTFP